MGIDRSRQKTPNPLSVWDALSVWLNRGAVPRMPKCGNNATYNHFMDDGFLKSSSVFLGLFSLTDW